MSQYSKYAEKHAGLTRREVEIMGYLQFGAASADIGDTLCVSKRTVDFHLQNIYNKLEVSNRVQALRKLAELGINLPENHVNV